MATRTPTTYPSTPLTGPCIRTRNQDEMTPGSGKIPGLWASFYKDILPHVKPGAAVYGIYSNYESDHNGAFDLSAAVACEHLANPSKDCVNSLIQAGSYLKFSPQTQSEDPVKEVIALWQEVWAYFEDEASEYKRAYSTDFELYHPDQKVELFIAIKSH